MSSLEDPAIGPIATGRNREGFGLKGPNLLQSLWKNGGITAMTDPARAPRPSAKLALVVVPVVTLLLGVLIGLVIARPIRWPGPRVAFNTPTRPFQRSDWEYPGAKTLVVQEGTTIEAKSPDSPIPTLYGPQHYVFSTPDPIETVWSHYAKLGGLKDVEFKPGTSWVRTGMEGSFSSSVIRGSVTQIMEYTGDRNRQSVRTGVLVIQQPEYTLVIFVSHGVDEKETHINLVVEKRSPQAAP